MESLLPNNVLRFGNRYAGLPHPRQSMVRPYLPERQCGVHFDASRVKNLDWHSPNRCNDRNNGSSAAEHYYASKSI